MKCFQYSLLGCIIICVLYLNIWYRPKLFCWGKRKRTKPHIVYLNSSIDCKTVPLVISLCFLYLKPSSPKPNQKWLIVATETCISIFETLSSRVMTPLIVSSLEDAVLSLLGILSLDQNFWPFLKIFGKIWKWTILVYFVNHTWFCF